MSECGNGFIIQLKPDFAMTFIVSVTGDKHVNFCLFHTFNFQEWDMTTAEFRS